jgi:hypothetical protein
MSLWAPLLMQETTVTEPTTDLHARMGALCTLGVYKVCNYAFLTAPQTRLRLKEQRLLSTREGGRWVEANPGGGSGTGWRRGLSSARRAGPPPQRIGRRGRVDQVARRARSGGVNDRRALRAIAEKRAARTKPSNLSVSRIIRCGGEQAGGGLDPPGPPTAHELKLLTPQFRRCLWRPWASTRASRGIHRFAADRADR